MYVNTYTSTYAYVCTCTYTHVHIYECVNINIFIYTYLSGVRIVGVCPQDFKGTSTGTFDMAMDSGECV